MNKGYQRIWTILTCAERHHTSPQVARVEWHVNARQRDCRKATLETNVALLFLLLVRLDHGVVDDLVQHLADLLNRECLS